MDEAYPGRPLHSADPAIRAKDKMLVELFNKVLMPIMRIIFGWKKGQGEEDRAAHWAECMQNLERFETELGQRKTAFFGGEDLPGYLDYMMWPWMERIEIFPLIFQVYFLCFMNRRKFFLLLKDEFRLAYQSARFPLLNTWMSKMKQDPAVQQYILDDETHAKFFRTMVSGSPNYDLLLNQCVGGEINNSQIRRSEDQKIKIVEDDPLGSGKGIS